MKRQYVRWSAIAGLLLTGSYGGYQGYQYVAGGSEPAVAEAPSQEAGPQVPALIADPDENIAVANSLLSAPDDIGIQEEAPIVRANDGGDYTPSSDYNPPSDYNPSGAFQPLGNAGGNLESNEGVSPAASDNGFSQNTLRSNSPAPLAAPAALGAQDTLGSGGVQPTELTPLNGGSAVPAVVGNPGIQQAPAPITPAPVGGQLNANQLNDVGPITQLPNQSAPNQSAPAPLNSNNQFELAPMTTKAAPVAGVNDNAGGSFAPNVGIPTPQGTSIAPAPLQPLGTANDASNSIQAYPNPNSGNAFPGNNGYPNNNAPVSGNPIGGFADQNAQPTQLPTQGVAGQGVPGARNLEGPQSPQVVVEKRSPQEIQVNVPATFEIVVRNVGTVDANNVTVVDQIPDGTQFVESSPAAQQAGGMATWTLGTLKPGDERVLSMVVMPTREGEVGSVASVKFEAKATSRTICTKPLLKVTHTAPQSVLAGEYVNFNITVTNPGTGAAYDVILEEDVPEGLKHEAGSELQHSLGTLPPGATRELQLTLLAEKAGRITNRLRVRGKGKVIAEDSIDLEIVAPELQLALDGPKRRYLNREATYTFSVYNPGTAPAKDVELISYLPKGFEFKEADKQGHYDPRKHAVYWSLTQLPPEQKGLVSLTVVPVEPGNHKVRAEGRAQQDLSAAHEHEVEVSGLAELKLTIADSADPIELGKNTVYEIRVTSTGSKDATNVRLVASLPPGLRPVGADGPTREQIEGQNVFFQALSRLETNSSTVFRVEAQGVGAGDQQIKVQVVCDGSQAPTVYEEVTRVYQD